jgi:hypothetical protein
MTITRTAIVEEQERERVIHRWDVEKKGRSRRRASEPATSRTAGNQSAARPGEGRELAKARGACFGRPKKLTPPQRRDAIERINTGEAGAEVEVARTFGVDRATVYRLKL